MTNSYSLLVPMWYAAVRAGRPADARRLLNQFKLNLKQEQQKMNEQQATPKTKRGGKRAAAAAPVERLPLTEAQFTGLWRLLTGDELVIEADPAARYHVSLPVLIQQLPALLEKIG